MRFLLPALIFLVNLLIAGRLFSVEHSAYLESNEGMFVAITRHIAERPWDLGWWPLWECGLPFVNTYLPGLPLAAGWFARWTVTEPGLAYHQVSTLLYCLGPVLVYFLVRAMTGRSGVAFYAALAYSVLSPCAWLSPTIRQDLSDPFRLRRIQILAYWGEAALTASMAAFPAALWALHKTKEDRRWWVACGAAMGVTVLFNAFGAVLLALAAVCWIATEPRDQIRKTAVGIAVTAALAYAWISPLVPPSVVAAIRANSPTVDGDYRFTTRSAWGVLILALAFTLVWFLLRKVESKPLRFFTLFAVLVSGIVLLGIEGAIYVVPQPHRYQLAMDLGIAVTLVLAIELAKSVTVRRTAAIVGLLLLASAALYNVRWGRELIRARDMASSAPFRMAKWAEQNLPGQRILIQGSHKFQFNEFTDSPQVFAGQKPFIINRFLNAVEYAIDTDQNAGERAGEITVLWLKALGAAAVAVPFPESSAYYKPAHPGKYAPLLKPVWQENGDVIYAVPGRRSTLAHVIPENALVTREPIHGLDVEAVRPFVAALDDPAMPEASLTWNGSSDARIQSTVAPGQVVHVQISFHPGWRASAGGKRVPIAADALGLMVLRPPCQGACEIDLAFDGGLETRLSRWASGISAIVAVIVLLV